MAVAQHCSSSKKDNMVLLTAAHSSIPQVLQSHPFTQLAPWNQVEAIDRYNSCLSPMHLRRILHNVAALHVRALEWYLPSAGRLYLVALG